MSHHEAGRIGTLPPATAEDHESERQAREEARRLEMAALATVPACRGAMAPEARPARTVPIAIRRASDMGLVATAARETVLLETVLLEVVVLEAVVLLGRTAGRIAPGVTAPGVTMIAGGATAGTARVVRAGLPAGETAVADPVTAAVEQASDGTAGARTAAHGRLIGPRGIDSRAVVAMETPSVAAVRVIGAPTGPKRADHTRDAAPRQALPAARECRTRRSTPTSRSRCCLASSAAHCAP